MILHTKDITLRHHKKSDLNTYHKLMNDQKMAEGMIFYPHPCPKRFAKKMLEERILHNRKHMKLEESFIIEYEGQIAGEIELRYIAPKLHAKAVYWIGKEFRGKGIATKALKLITRYGFEYYGLRRVDAFVRTYNKASIRVLEKAGFKREGKLKKHVLKNGKYYDDYIYAKVR